MTFIGPQTELNHSLQCAQDAVLALEGREWLPSLRAMYYVPQQSYWQYSTSPPSPANSSNYGQAPAPMQDVGVTIGSPITSSFSTRELAVLPDMAKHLPPNHVISGAANGSSGNYTLATFVPPRLWTAIAPIAFTFTVAGDHV